MGPRRRRGRQSRCTSFQICSVVTWWQRTEQSFCEQGHSVHQLCLLQSERQQSAEEAERAVSDLSRTSQRLLGLAKHLLTFAASSGDWGELAARGGRFVERCPCMTSTVCAAREARQYSCDGMRLRYFTSVGHAHLHLSAMSRRETARVTSLGKTFPDGATVSTIWNPAMVH